jgi:hypothetical protein
MADPLAVWGALTGTAGFGLAARREVLAGRRRLAVAPNCNFNLSREDEPRLTQTWARVAFWNVGGRPLAVEHVGFSYFVVDPQDDALHMWEYTAEIPLPAPIELPVDGPTRKVSTPMGPLLSAGLSPVEPIIAFAITTGGRRWQSPPQMLISAPPRGISLEHFSDDLATLRDAAVAPPDRRPAGLVAAGGPVPA